MDVSCGGAVSTALWTKCNELLESQKGGRRSRAVVNLFSGLTYCGNGHKMYVPSRLAPYSCARCRERISAPELELIFRRRLREITKRTVGTADPTVASGRAGRTIQHPPEVRRIRCVHRRLRVWLLGITDYFGIERYLQVREHQRQGRLPGVGLIFPNVELRLSIETSSDARL